MFDQLKAMGALAGLMRDKDRLAASSRRVREKLAAVRATASAGAGAVEAVATGEMRLEAVRLSPAIAIAADDCSRTMAETLIAQAINDALDRARQAAAAIIEAEARELGLADVLGEKGLAALRGARGAGSDTDGELANLVRGLLT